MKYFQKGLLKYLQERVEDLSRGRHRRRGPRDAGPRGRRGSAGGRLRGTAELGRGFRREPDEDRDRGRHRRRGSRDADPPGRRGSAGERFYCTSVPEVQLLAI